jgi:hypothetical protein
MLIIIICVRFASEPKIQSAAGEVNTFKFTVTIKVQNNIFVCPTLGNEPHPVFISNGSGKVCAFVLVSLLNDKLKYKCSLNSYIIYVNTIIDWFVIHCVFQ